MNVTVWYNLFIDNPYVEKIMEIMSESIKEISKALSVVQGKIPNVKKSNAGHGYKYADLGDCLELIKKPLLESELALTQILSITEDGSPILVTMLIHSSGEWLKSVFPLKPQGSKMTNDMQALGSGITYLRRYALCSMLGIAQEDDDGVLTTSRQATPVAKVEPKINVDVAKLQTLCVANGIEAKSFAKFHNITSSDLETVQDAVERFDILSAAYSASLT